MRKEIIMVWLAIVLGVLLVLVALSNLALQKRVTALSEEVEELRAGQGLDERVAYLMHKGRTTEAVAVYRSATGLTPKESRHAVDVIARHNPRM